jgi:molybdopterin-guanine dinucleotide biosynthesis protein A
VNAALSLAILAGGNSQRFGEDKALAQLNGKPLVGHMLDRLQGVAAETLLVTNRPAEYGQFNQRLVGDVLPGRGALGGLHAALYHATRPWVACLACDMPLVSRGLVEYLVTLRAEADVVMPRLNGLWEPMHAVWSRACLGPVQAALERGERRMISCLPDLNVRVVTEAEIDRIDPEHLSFMNINTTDQLAEMARRLAGHDN